MVERGPPEKFPLIDFEQFSEMGGWRLPFLYAGYKIAEHLRDRLEKDRTDKKKSILGELMNSYRIKWSQDFDTVVANAFPKPYAWYRFSEGASTIDVLYTVEHGGLEYPVYMLREDQRKPEEKELAENIEYVVKNGESPYESVEKIRPFYNDNFSKKAAVKLTRGDFSRLADPRHFTRWFVMDDTWLIQQYGKEIERMEISTSAGRKTVKAYKRPGKGAVFSYWFAGDLIYDLIDGPFDVIQRRIEKYMNEDAERVFLKNEYKMISGVIRSLFNPKPVPLTYG